VIIDQVSGPVASQNLFATRVQGRIVNVGRLGGERAEFDFDRHAMQRITYIGVTFRTRSIEEVHEICQRMQADLGGAVAAGQLTMPIDAVFPLDAAAEAFARMRKNAHFGKIVLAF
jgi:NADPH2:quinone reductase